MPGTDSLTIRHTPGTVPGGARPGWGLPHKQLPAATRKDLTPESYMDEQIQSGRQQIQDKYALRWKEVNRSKRFVGAGKTKRMLQEIDTKAKQEMLQFNQQAQAQMAQLDSINRLAEQGFISPEDAARIKAGEVFGSDVARSMYPPSKLPEQEWSALQIPLNKIESRLAQFRRPKKRISSVWLGKKKEGRAPGDIEVYDRSMIDEETGEMGVWRKAAQQEITERGMLLQQQQRIKQLQTSIFEQPDVRQRIVQPGTRGGTFDDKVAESVRPQPTRRSTPKIIRQRNRTTGKERISYDGGRTWQMTG